MSWRENYMKLKFLCPQIKFSWNLGMFTHFMCCLCCFHTAVTWVVATESGWPKPEVFVIWPFPRKVCWPLVCKNRMILTQSGPLLGAAADQASLSPIGVQRPWGHLGKLGVPLGRDRQSWMLGRPPPIPTTSTRKHGLTFNFSMKLS